MSANYRTESQAFKKNFVNIKHKKIVIYGIGRCTVTLIPEITDYNIIGFLDRDAENIGLRICGIPILSLKEAEERADIIIINTVEAYWKSIFSRIQHINIPIYYRNGEKAIVETKAIGSLPYWSSTYEQLCKLSKEYTYISFDFFDTLFMRKVYLPKDIFSVMENRLSQEWGEKVDFRVFREHASAAIQERNFSLDDIYEKFADLTLWNQKQIEYAKALEMELEAGFLVPRTEIINLYRNLLVSGHKVYIISDMYLPIKWFDAVLKKHNINCSMDAIWISCEKKVDKLNGSMWKLFKDKELKGGKALHIGDNQISDIDMPKMHGIDSYYVMSARDIMSVSSLKNVENSVSSQMSANILGLIAQNVFCNPFAINNSHGIIKFNSPEAFGYSVFGPVIQMFLIWLLQSAKRDGIKKLIFFARDGYFLKIDFDFFLNDVLKLRDNIPQSEYLLISRKIVMSASVCNEFDFKEYIRFPFSGNFEEYMKVRFNYELLSEPQNIKSYFISLPQDETVVLDMLNPYIEQLHVIMNSQRQEYLEYLNSLHIDQESAVVDTWYYGNTQFYLNKLIDKELKGYYFAANLSSNNKCNQYSMLPCFQDIDDLKAERCQIFQKALIIESFLTAPYGMIKEVKADSTFNTFDIKENQKSFAVKEKINQGIKNFIKDFGQFYSSDELLTMNPETLFVDRLFMHWFEHGCELSEEIKNSFWSDNEMVQTREFGLFD